jgi:hypothetical protein
LAILGQKSLDRFGNTFPVQIKNYSPLFVTEGQRVKQSNKNQLQIKITPPNSLRRTRVNRVILVQKLNKHGLKKLLKRE